MKTRTRIYAPDGDTGSSGTVTASNLFDAPKMETTQETVQTKEVEPVTTETQQSQAAATPEVKPAAPPVVQQPAQAPAIDGEKLAQSIVQAQARAAELTKSQQPKTLSQEEYNRTFNIPSVDDKTFTAILGFAPDKPEQVKALADYGQSIAKQAVTMAHFLVREEVAKITQQFESRLGPITAHTEAQQGAQLLGEFFTSNPDLKDYEALVKEIGNNLRKEGKQFASKAELFQFVADRTRGFLPKNVGNTATQTGTQSQTQPQVQTRTMAPLSGGGNAGASNQSATGSNLAQQLFNRRD